MISQASYRQGAGHSLPVLQEGLNFPPTVCRDLIPSFQFEVNERWQGWLWRKTSVTLQSKCLKVLAGSPGKHRLLSSSESGEAASANSKVQENPRAQDQAHRHKRPHPRDSEWQSYPVSMRPWLEGMMEAVPRFLRSRGTLLLWAQLSLQIACTCRRGGRLSEKGANEGFWHGRRP